jgi:acyl-ACP thioesterase
VADTPAARVERPDSGRIFEGSRKVRVGDAGPRGRLRLDAAVRYLQDLSADDTADAALPDAEAWVVRRTVLEVQRFPNYLEALQLATWCSGIGSHYAERRVTIRGDRGGHIDGATLWVSFDPRTGRPRRVPEGFAALYGEAARGRTIKARLLHPSPPEGLVSTPWAVRSTDADVVHRVNNAAYWHVVEEARAAHGGIDAPLRAELEHHRALEPGEAVTYLVDETERGLRLWILGDGSVAASAVLSAHERTAQ